MHSIPIPRIIAWRQLNIETKGIDYDPRASLLFDGWNNDEYLFLINGKNTRMFFDPEHYIEPLLPTRLVPQLDLDPMTMLDEDKYHEEWDKRRSFVEKASSDFYVSINEYTKSSFDYIHRTDAVFEVKNKSVDHRSKVINVLTYQEQESQDPRIPESLFVSILDYSKTLFHFNYRTHRMKQILACLVGTSCSGNIIDRDEWLYFPILHFEMLRRTCFDMCQDDDDGMIFTLRLQGYRDTTIRVRHCHHSVHYPSPPDSIQGAKVYLEPILGTNPVNRHHSISRYHNKRWTTFLCRMYSNELVDQIMEGVFSGKFEIGWFVHCAKLILQPDIARPKRPNPWSGKNRRVLRIK